MCILVGKKTKISCVFQKLFFQGAILAAFQKLIMDETDNSTDEEQEVFDKIDNYLCDLKNSHGLIVDRI